MNIFERLDELEKLALRVANIEAVLGISAKKYTTPKIVKSAPPPY